MTPSPHPAEAQEREAIDAEMKAYFDGEYMDHSTVRERLKALWQAARAPHAPTTASSEALTLQHGTPHSLGGFRGAFVAEHGRTPTEQEVWNGAIASWRDLNPAAASGEAVTHGDVKSAISAAIGFEWMPGELQPVNADDLLRIAGAVAALAQANPAAGAEPVTDEQIDAIDLRKFHGSPSAKEWLRGVARAVLALAKANPAAGAESVHIEAVATTVRRDDGSLDLDWLLEGGVSALECEGVVLCVSDRALTGDDGSGEIYLAPPATSERDAEDAARWRWLTEDHADPVTRSALHALLERLPVMSYSAACAAIDAQREQSEKRSGEGI